MLKSRLWGFSIKHRISLNKHILETTISRTISDVQLKMQQALVFNPHESVKWTIGE